MSLAICPIYTNKGAPTFSQNTIKENNKEIKQEKACNENPVSRTGEAIDMIKTTFVAGLGLSVMLLMKLYEFDTEPDKTAKTIYNALTKKIKDKNILIKIGVTVSSVVAGVCGLALLYALINAPHIVYESKVKTYKKEKEMDIYIKANNSEAMLYEQLIDKAKGATTQQEQNKLKEQFAQLSLAKNQLPEFIQKEIQSKEIKKNKKNKK